MKMYTTDSSLFGDLPVAELSRPRPETTGTRRSRAESAEALIPGLDSFMAKISASDAGQQSEKIVAERLRQSVKLYGFSSSMNVQAASNLWKSVIVRAYKDAIGLDLLLTNEDDDDEDDDGTVRVTDPKSVQERGIRWFVEFSEDFRHVCWFAGYEPDEVQRYVLSDLEKRELVYLTTKGRYKIDREELGRKEDAE